MATQTLPENPVEAVKEWLLHDWKGSLRPIDVAPLLSEDSDGRDAWFFVVILPPPQDETWDPAELAELQRGLRDKALEVGLPYPWYVVPRSQGEEEVPEDDEDLPEDAE